MGFNVLSTSETLNPDESTATQEFKLVRLARSFRTLWLENSKAEISVYGYMRNEAAGSTIRERDESASIQQRLNSVCGTLNQLGVPKDKVWKVGSMFSSNRGGQIDVFIRNGESTFIIPPYPPYVTPSGPRDPSAPREQWEVEAEVNTDLKEIVAEVGLSYKDSLGNRTSKPSISVKFGVAKDGSMKEIGAELTLLKQKLASQVFWGVVSDVKIAAKIVGLAEFKKDEAQRYTNELNAKLKLALSADVALPGTKIKIPVEFSLYTDVAGKVGGGVQVTIIQF